MISVLAQERLLGAALGSIFTGVVVFEQRKSIYHSISENQSQFVPQSQMREPILGKKSRLEFAHLWNKAVDQTLGPAIEFLSSRGWDKTAHPGVELRDKYPYYYLVDA